MLLPRQVDVPDADYEAPYITGRCQSVYGGVAAGATEARALRAGAPNLRQAVESRDNENIKHAFTPWG